MFFLNKYLRKTHVCEYMCVIIIIIIIIIMLVYYAMTDRNAVQIATIPVTYVQITRKCQ